MKVNLNFLSSKRVLIMGHIGFKCGWLALWLQQLGADVTGIALPPNTTPSLFEIAHVESHICDIRDAAALAALVGSAQPEVIFHLAAQKLVRAS